MINKKVAIIGAPNVGKSSVLNQLKLNNYFSAGNWSGFTTKKKVGIYSNKNKNICISFSDLPGIYSLTPRTKEEKITINEILSDDYDIFAQVIDASDLQTSLNLTLLLVELEIPLVIFLNFTDKISKYKLNIDIQKLERALNVPIFIVSGINKQYSKSALEKITSILKDNDFQKKQRNYFFYSDPINTKIKNLENNIKNSNCNEICNRELKAYRYYLLHSAYKKIINNLTARVYNDEKNNEYNDVDDISKLNYDLCQKRQKYINNIIKLSCNKYDQYSKKSIIWSLRLDKIFLNKWLALPIYLAILFITFIMVFNFSTPLKNFLSDVFTIYLPSVMHLNVNIWYQNFLANGLFSGIGTLISFVPVMILLFIVVSFIQQSGIMARCAFILNRAFSKLGLNGKSILPFILGFGCNVASVYSARVIKNKQQRESTALLSSFMPCSARIVVFGLFASTFFPHFAGIIIFSLYFFGIFVAIFLAFLIKLFTGYRYDNEYNEFIELVPYQVPSFHSLMQGVKHSVKSYLKRALTVILAFSIFIWFLSYFPYGNGHINESFLSYFKYILKPIFTPLGFGYSWILCVAIIPGIIAKEIVVASLALLYGISTYNHIPSFWIDIKHTLEYSFINLLPNHWFNSDLFSIVNNNSLSSKIFRDISSYSKFPQLVSYCYLIFILLTIPCITTLSSLYDEFGYKTVLKAIFMGIFVPYFFSFIIYQLFDVILVRMN